MSRLDTNVQHLGAQHDRIAPLLRNATPGCIAVMPSRSGDPTAKVGERWVHSAYDPIKESRQWAAAQHTSWNEGEIAVVFGVGLLYHVEALRSTAPSSRKIVVVVPDLGEFRCASEARDWDVWVSGVHWITGDPAAVSRELAGLGEPLRILSYGPAASLHGDYYQALETHLRERLAEQAGGRLHVAVIGPIYGGSLPVAGYVASALETLGHRVTYVDHSLHQASYEAVGRLQSRRNQHILQGSYGELLGQFSMARMAEDPPDVVLALAQAPLSLGVLQQLRKKQFVTAMWFVENYRHLTYWQQVAAGYDYWFVIQREPCIGAVKGAGARHISYVPMAADPSVHRPVMLTEAERSEFGSDVSFVGAGYANRRELLPQFVSEHWSFKLWGNEWDGAEALRSVVQRNGARIDTATCVKIFNASTINLNLHSHAGQGFDPHGDFVNPRTFELAACGAFQVVDRRTLLPELFRPHEVATVEAPAELSAAIRRWLQDEAGRTAMSQAARKRVLAEHTYVHRVRQMLSEIGLSQPDRVGALLRGAREAEQLVKRAGDCPELTPLLRASQSKDRVELQDVAAEIRRKGPTARLTQAELLILMMDEYRIETRDVA